MRPWPASLVSARLLVVSLGRLAGGFPGRAARGLAVAGDHLGRAAQQRAHPGCEATLELHGIQACEDIAQVIMRRRAIQERPEPSEEHQLAVAEAGNVSKGFRLGQHTQ
jgi:hypothetical protein